MRYAWCVGVLLQNAFETTPFADARRLRNFPPRLAEYQVSTKHNVSCCSSRPWMASIFPSFDTLLLSILFSNLSRLVLPFILCWNSRSSRRKRNPGCWLSHAGCATLCYKFDEYRANRCVQNKTLLKWAKNCANWFRHFENVGLSSQTWASFLGHLVCAENRNKARNYAVDIACPKKFKLSSDIFVKK